jgi:hypothetical protein
MDSTSEKDIFKEVNTAWEGNAGLNTLDISSRTDSLRVFGTAQPVKTSFMANR